MNSSTANSTADLHSRRILNFQKYANDFTSTLYKSVAREIVDESWERFNVTVDYDASLWLVKLFAMNPMRRIRVNTSYEQADIDNFIGKCLEIISDPNDLFLATLKLQIYYMKHQTDAVAVINKFTANLQTQMSPLTQTIMSTRLHTKNLCEDLMKKIAVDTIVQYSLGDPSTPEVMTETVNALKSITSTNDIIKFSLLPEPEKHESMIGLRDIVCGIRVFNKDAGHCGEGLIDMEDTIRSGCVATKLQLNNSKLEAIKCIKSILHLLNYTDGKPIVGERKRDMVKLIILFRQCQQMQDDLFESFLEVQVHCDQLLISFRNCLNRIHNTVKYRVAVAIERIFPKFIELAKIWQLLEYKLIIMSEINTVNEQLMSLSTDAAKRVGISTEPKLCPDAEHPVKTGQTGEIQAKIVADNELIRIVTHHDKLKLEYNGFCAWTLSTTCGLLLPANTNIGIICYDNRYYGFESVYVANKFQRNVDVCLRNICDVIYENPQLAILLNVYRCATDGESAQMPMDHVVGSASQSPVAPSNCIEIQTDTHPIPYHKDEKYVWNKWDLRRKAIKLADMQQSRTHSTQTTMTYHRSSFGIQYGTSSNAAQTNKQVETQTQALP